MSMAFQREMIGGLICQLPDTALNHDETMELDGSWMAERIITRLPIEPREGMSLKNWDEIRYFLAVARHGSVSAAAKGIGVSHATVLRHVDELEKVLGVKLFRRLQSGYQLSNAGETFYEDALEVESAVLRSISRAHGAEEPSTAMHKYHPPSRRAQSPLAALRNLEIRNVFLRLRALPGATGHHRYRTRTYASLY